MWTDISDNVRDPHPILAIYSLELIHIHYLTIESGKTYKDINVLIVIDHFTYYAQAYALPSQTARLVAHTLKEKLIIHYRLHEKILSDQG